MKTISNLLCAFTLLALSLNAASYAADAEKASKKTDDSQFLIKPFLQLGDNPALLKKEREDVLWVCPSAENTWHVEYKQTESQKWTSVKPNDIAHHALLDAPVPSVEIYQCTIRDLIPGKKFYYQVKLGDAVLFASNAVARKPASEPYRVAIFGDCGSGSEGQRLIATRSFQTTPDLVIIPGDIVYEKGQFSDYLKKFYPVYNADSPSATGVPLLRTTLVMPVIGNHDIALQRNQSSTDLNKYTDALAYYVLWDTPMNGPEKKRGSINTPPISGDSKNVDNFLQSADKHFPGGALYSFDYGNSHWTVLDGNHYMDYNDPQTREWIKADIEKSNAHWKFVTFHQPGFSMDIEHKDEQRMRVLADLFEKAGVDIVFCGHVHNYQRTFPLKFAPQIKDGKVFINANGTVPGKFSLDKKFDGIKNTRPNGIVYLVTGGGGARLYSQVEAKDDSVNFVDKAFSETYSFTECDIAGGTFSAKQIAADGRIIDEFKITKD